MKPHDRGFRTMLSVWETYAAGAEGAAVHHDDGATTVVFPSGPEGEFFNNAALRRGVPVEPAVDGIVERYAAAGVERFAIWVTDDAAAGAVLERRGFTVDTTSAAMVVDLDRRIPVPAFDSGPSTWSAYRSGFLPTGMCARTDARRFRVATAQLDGAVVSAAIAYELDGDVGIYNVETREHARRRGLATAITAYLLNNAFTRGATTASLQATPMAERVYAACGFRTVARIVEYVPGA